MKNLLSQKKTWLVLLVVIGLVVILVKTGCHKKADGFVVVELKPVLGNISQVVATTGTVEPQNRLEIKPPIGGRIEEIRVREGQPVKAGDILALMSSTERASLLDAARLKNPGELAMWQRVYKATPLVAPIDGIVIVRPVEPGQTVVAGDVVLVLSDRLIIKAQVDEVDIGRIKLGQKAVVGLDAYPETKVNAVIDHISYESRIINNVTIYEVDVLPETVPEIFRSGMSATVDVIEQQHDNVMLIPREAVIQDQGEPVVMIKGAHGQKVRTKVVLSLADDKNVEVLSGLTMNDTVTVERKETISFDSNKPKNPFMPKFGKDKK